MKLPKYTQLQLGVFRLPDGVTRRYCHCNASLFLHQSKL